MKILEKDKKLLAELQKDATQSSRQLSKKLDIPASTLHVRKKKLEDAGVIQRYTVVLDYEQVGLPSIAFVIIHLQHANPVSGEPSWTTKSIADELAKISGVCEVHGITGRYDMMVKMRGKNERDMGTIISKMMRDLPAISGTETCFAIHTAKEKYNVNLSKL